MFRYLVTALISICFVATPLLAEVAPGDVAPDFSLQDQDGKTVKLSDFKGKVVVLEWTNPECPFVKRLHKAKTMEQLYGKHKADDVVWLAINSTHWMDNDENQSFRKEYGITYPVLSDTDGSVGKKYGARTTPHMYVIDQQGKVAYSGAIDNDPMGNEDQPTNYVEATLTALGAGKGIQTSETKPYGCSVKYRMVG